MLHSLDHKTLKIISKELLQILAKSLRWIAVKLNGFQFFNDFETFDKDIKIHGLSQPVKSILSSMFEEFEALNALHIQTIW